MALFSYHDGTYNILYFVGVTTFSGGDVPIQLVRPFSRKEFGYLLNILVSTTGQALQGEISVIKTYASGIRCQSSQLQCLYRQAASWRDEQPPKRRATTPRLQYHKTSQNTTMNATAVKVRPTRNDTLELGAHTEALQGLLIGCDDILCSS